MRIMLIGNVIRHFNFLGITALLWSLPLNITWGFAELSSVNIFMLTLQKRSAYDRL